MSEQEFTPVVITQGTGAQEEKVHLFSIEDEEGNATKYYAFKRVPFRVTLKAAKIFADHGEAQAQAYAMTQVLGEDAYDALCESEDITEEQFGAILDYANKVVMGPGKSQNEPNRASRRGKRK